MTAFYYTLGTVLAICIGVMPLIIFIWLLVKFDARLARRSGKIDVTKIKGFLAKGARVNVYLSNGKQLDNLKLIGVANASKMKDNFPYQLNNMLLLEDQDGKRIMLKPSSIRMFEEIPDVKTV